MYIREEKSSPAYRLICSFTVISFLLTTILPPSYAQAILNLPSPGSMVTMSAGFAPPIIRGLTLYPDNPLRFDFIVDTGDNNLNGKEFEAETTKLIRYFLASLTTPEDDLWVNLSPYEKDRIVPESFGTTEMGRDLLAQDYLLKQITASLIYPEEELGKKFWDKVYAEAQAKYGTSEIPINTFNKVWIVPEKAVVFEKDNIVFVEESRLKVMLEQDYLALSKSDTLTQTAQSKDPQEVNQIGSEIVREIILPELEKEVNEGKNFAQLRQVYHALILATWYKQKIKDSILNKVYSDQNKVAGVEINDEDAKQKIYEQYLEAFKKGVYNYIKEDYDAVTQETIPRKYFSGGFALQMRTKMGSPIITTASEHKAEVKHAFRISADIQPVRNLNRFIRIFRNLFSGDEKNLADDQKMVSLIGVLKSRGMAQERPEPLTNQDGDQVFINDQPANVKVITIKKEGEAQRFYDAFVNRQIGGIQAINFKDAVTGQWYVVGFEGDVDQKLQHEKDEIIVRMQIEKARLAGDDQAQQQNWIDAHNATDHQKIDKTRAQKFEAGVQDIFGTGFRDWLRKKMGKETPATDVPALASNKNFKTEENIDRLNSLDDLKEQAGPQLIFSLTAPTTPEDALKRQHVSDTTNSFKERFIQQGYIVAGEIWHSAYVRLYSMGNQVRGTKITVEVQNVSFLEELAGVKEFELVVTVTHLDAQGNPLFEREKITQTVQSIPTPDQIRTALSKKFPDADPVAIQDIINQFNRQPRALTNLINAYYHLYTGDSFHNRTRVAILRHDSQASD